jgi:tetratricopeptide (TPR) repeat protein
MNGVYNILALLAVTWHVVAYFQSHQEKCAILSELHFLEDKIFSQNGEDGILIALLELIGIKRRYYVEFGVEDGFECNTRILREIYGYEGLMMDGGNENLEINLRKEFITEENVLDLFDKYGVPTDFDVLSIDVDMFDFWVLARILRDGGYRPRIIVVETNPTICLNKKLTSHAFAKVNSVPLTVVHPNMTEQNVWDLSRYAGANPLAFRLLGEKFGYDMVYCERCGVNCFLVLRNELPEGCRGTSTASAFQPMSPYPCFGTSRTGGAYPGHEYDPHGRSAVRLGPEVMRDIVIGNLTLDTIEGSMQSCPSFDTAAVAVGDLCNIALPSNYYRDVAIIEAQRDMTPRSSFDSVNSLFMLVNDLMLSGAYESATMTLQRFLSREDRRQEDPGDASISNCISNHPSEYSCTVESAAFYNLGLSSLMLGRYADAMASFQRASDRNKREERYRVMNSLVRRLQMQQYSEVKEGEIRIDDDSKSTNDRTPQDPKKKKKQQQEEEGAVADDKQLLGYVEVQFDIMLPTGESTSHKIGASVCQNVSNTVEEFRVTVGLSEAEGKVIENALREKLEKSYFDAPLLHLLRAAEQDDNEDDDKKWFALRDADNQMKNNQSQEKVFLHHDGSALPTSASVSMRSPFASASTSCLMGALLSSQIFHRLSALCTASK